MPGLPPHARYQLLAIDLDGTLLDSAGAVSPANLEAIRRARAAGVRIIICTGRGLAECRHVLDAIGQQDPVVVAGGSIVASPTGDAARSTMHRFGLGLEIVSRATEHLLSRGLPAMVLKDPSRTHYDYLMVQGEAMHPLDPVTIWWLESMGIRTRYARLLHEDEHPEDTVRLGACALSGRLDEIHDELAGTIGPDVSMHHFPAVVAPEHARRTPQGECLHILEVFSRDANKWSAVCWAAAELGVERSRIAAIGDQINDLPMIRGAQEAGGLGVAMGNAVERVARAAGARTMGHDQDGVAHAIHSLLDGLWDDSGGLGRTDTRAEAACPRA
jgi:5-amino-6-(5-phospho-D-ribitylamino)uracil phosphatase